MFNRFDLLVMSFGRVVVVVYCDVVLGVVVYIFVCFDFYKNYLMKGRFMVYFGISWDCNCCILVCVLGFVFR